VATRRLWRGALVRACNSNVAAYDTLFVELAVREQKPLATFDAKLLAAFPDVALRPKALIQSRLNDWPANVGYLESANPR